MFQKNIGSIKKLAKKVTHKRRSHNREKVYAKERLLVQDVEECVSTTTPRGFLAVYVGDERKRFVVLTSSLSHPLFKILLAKASEEFGYEQKNGLAVPCSVEAFQEASIFVIIRFRSALSDVHLRILAENKKEHVNLLWDFSPRPTPA
nr:auxin-responsive protein SAUR15-like [Tanacetum cinerariifolium]